MNARREIPDDPALPGLRAIRALGVAGALLALGLDDEPVELRLRAHKEGSHATLEARAGHRHLAIKAYVADPAPEAALHEAFAAAGLTEHAAVRVPSVYLWERDLRVLVVAWLEGPTVHELLKDGQGARAGTVAARWLQRAASLRLQLGPPCGAAQVLHRADKWVAALTAADAALGTAATRILERLAGRPPVEAQLRVVHGSLHDRNVLDLGDAVGVIDWQRFGQGPPELEAGMFLAAVTRVGLMHAPLAREAAEAEAAFAAGTRELVDQRAVGWHRAAGLLRLAERQLTHRKRDWAARAQVLLGAATRLIGAPRALG